MPAAPEPIMITSDFMYIWYRSRRAWILYGLLQA
jgi:hypothetical protein